MVPRGEAHDALAAGRRLQHFRAQFIVAEDELRPRLQPAPGPRQRLPDIRTGSLQQQQLGQPAGGSFLPEQPRGDHPRIVQHQQIPCTQIVRQLAEAACSMTPLARCSTSKREASRGVTGCWAINASGKS